MIAIFCETISFTSNVAQYLSDDEYRRLQSAQFWMFTLYNKDKMENLTEAQERQLKQAITVELAKRGIS